MIIKMRYDNIQLFPKVNYDKEYVDLISMCTKKNNALIAILYVSQFIE